MKSSTPIIQTLRAIGISIVQNLLSDYGLIFEEVHPVPELAEQSVRDCDSENTHPAGRIPSRCIQSQQLCIEDAERLTTSDSSTHLE